MRGITDGYIRTYVTVTYVESQRTFAFVLSSKFPLNWSRLNEQLIRRSSRPKLLQQTEPDFMSQVCPGQIVVKKNYVDVDISSCCIGTVLTYIQLCLSVQNLHDNERLQSERTFECTLIESHVNLVRANISKCRLSLFKTVAPL